MSKFIRFDEDHFGYLVDYDLTDHEAHLLVEQFSHAYPDKRLIVMQADEFIDLTGQYEIVPTSDPPLVSVTYGGSDDSPRDNPLT